MTSANGRRRVSLLDLTVDQVEQLEADIGLPMDRWTDGPSKAALYRKVYAIAAGVSPADVGRMTLRELTESVDMGDDEDPT